MSAQPHQDSAAPRQDEALFFCLSLCSPPSQPLVPTDFSVPTRKILDVLSFCSLYLYLYSSLFEYFPCTSTVGSVEHMPSRYYSQCFWSTAKPLAPFTINVDVFGLGDTSQDVSSIARSGEWPSGHGCSCLSMTALLTPTAKRASALFTT